MADDSRWYVTRPLTYIERRELDGRSRISDPFQKNAGPEKPSVKANNNHRGSGVWIPESLPLQKPK
jgi:hypothetical protein